MRIAKRIAAALFTLAATVLLLQATGIDAQAATKSHTYVQDKKSGLGYPTAVRVGVGSIYQDFEVYLKNKGDYVAKVTTSGGLIAKKTETYSITSDNSYTSHDTYFGDTRFKGRSRITCFAPKAGTYKVTLTIKNAKNKQIAKKTIKILAGDTSALASLTYAGKDVGYETLTSKAKGKLVVKANKDFTIKKIQVGGYKSDGTIQWKTAKNKSTITLSTVKQFTEKEYSYSSSDYSYESFNYYDYIYPVTFIKVTVYDKKLKITYDVEREIFKQ